MSLSPIPAEQRVFSPPPPRAPEPRFGPAAVLPASVSTLGRLLRARRNALGLGLREVSNRLQARGVRGADFWCVGLWERDLRQPSLEQFAHLIQILEIPRGVVGTALRLARVSSGVPLPAPGPCRWHPSTPRLGVLLRRRRAELGLSGFTVAQRLAAVGCRGAHEQHVHDWERGDRTPLLEQLATLLTVLEFEGHAIGLMLGQVAGRVFTGVPAPSDYQRSSDRPDRLDVGQRIDDVRRLLHSLPEWRGALRVGADPDDLEQRVLEGLVRRQIPRADGLANWSAYDPQRAGLAKYLVVACRGLVLHELEAMGAERRDRETVGAAVATKADEPRLQVDAAQVARDDSDPTEEGDASELANDLVAEVRMALGWRAAEEARELIEGRATVKEVRAEVAELVRQCLTRGKR